MIAFIHPKTTKSINTTIQKIRRNNIGNNETKLKTLHQKREAIQKGGGEKRVQKQHQSGKLTAREKIEQLLDPESFIEVDAFVKHRSINLTCKIPSPGRRRSHRLAPSTADWYSYSPKILPQ